MSRRSISTAGGGIFRPVRFLRWRGFEQSQQHGVGFRLLGEVVDDLDAVGATMTSANVPTAVVTVRYTSRRPTRSAG
jgi:hypothetical protein